MSLESGLCLASCVFESGWVVVLAGEVVVLIGEVVVLAGEVDRDRDCDRY